MVNPYLLMAVLYLAVGALTAVDASLTESDWMTDLNSNPLAGWYNYNPMTHEITPSDSVYVLRCADGNHYAKFQVNVIDNPGMSNPGTLTLNYVHQATAGNLDLSATPQSFQVDCSSGAAYISFASAGQVTVADPLTSMDWDLFVDGYDIHFNAGEYGPGTAGGYSAQLADLNHADVHCLMIPYSAAYNREAAPEAMAAISRALGGKDPAEGLYALMRAVGRKSSLAEMGLGPAEIERAADIAVQNPYYNPRPVTREGVLEMLQAALEGRQP